MKYHDRHKNTLIKMFFIENLGESIYNALSFKTSDNNNKAIYKKLSKNESSTANHIIQELHKLGVSKPIIRKALLKFFAFIIFSILPDSILKKLLKRTLKKSMFKSWFNLYHTYNKDFWDLMVEHEELQHSSLIKI